MEGEDSDRKSAPDSSKQRGLLNEEADVLIEPTRTGVGAGSARYIALAEQALISGSNFLLYIYAARMLPKEQWGALSFALASLQVLQGFQRAFVTIPLMTSGEQHGSFAGTLGFWNQIQGWVTGMTLILILFIYVAAHFAMDDWVSDSMLLAAILLIPV